MKSEQKINQKEIWQSNFVISVLMNFQLLHIINYIAYIIERAVK